MPLAVKNQYRNYVHAHRTKGCRISHLFGVPISLIGLFMLPFNPKRAACVLTFGYSFQIVGHFVFEKNNPVLLTTRDPRIIVMAAIMISRDWKRIARGARYYTGYVDSNRH